MTAPAPEIALLGVWDTRLPNYWGVGSAAGVAEASVWAQTHIEGSKHTYRIEFYLLDTPFADLYRYAQRDGHPYTDPATNEPATEQPVRQILGELPPAHLLRGSDG